MMFVTKDFLFLFLAASGAVQAFTTPSAPRASFRTRLFYGPRGEYDSYDSPRYEDYPRREETRPYPRDSYFEEDYREERYEGSSQFDKPPLDNYRGDNYERGGRDYYPRREDEDSYYSDNNNNWNGQYGWEYGREEPPRDFYEGEGRDYESYGGSGMAPRMETPDRIPGRDYGRMETNLPGRDYGRSRGEYTRRDRTGRSRGEYARRDRTDRRGGRRIHKAISLSSDGIPGRNQNYANSKADFSPRRDGPRRDMWSSFLGATGSAMDASLDTVRRTAELMSTAFSPDLKKLLIGQKLTMQPVLEEALRSIRADPACQDLLGADIRLDQPLTQLQSTGSLDGPYESQVQVQVTAEGSRDKGLLDVYANDGTIREMLLTVAGRQINVKLGRSANYDLVDRGISSSNRRERMPSFRRHDVMDAEFEVSRNGRNNNNTGYNNDSLW